MRTAKAILLLTLALVVVSCGNPPPTDDSAAHLRIAATIPPLEWIARGLAPEDDTEISTLLPPGASEHGYEPPPSRLAAFVRADLVLMVGLGLEPAADRALRASPRGGRSIVVFADVPAIAQELARSSPAHAGHDHASDDDHSAHAHETGASDPHLWLDPILMRGYVEAVHDSMARRLSRSGADESALTALAARRDAMLAEVDAVHALYLERLAPYQGAAVVSAHDSVRRLADRYGLRVAGVLHIHGGAEPTPDAIMRAAAALREAEHRAVLAEPQTPRALGQRLSRETGAPLAEFDPIGSGDWAATMRTNLESLVAAFETPRGDSR